ncbi:MAG: hypothetical protein Barrevirus3_12 [Barrevirus sp.]|uniref:Uncharacterized protein n=1 Tax=Barrevirus sp. TaxID=2487763 RepID=A0A3G4ZPQ9_9VIRU|nr:MAG: hypothetical protein Barrevirus3_12 [Barrevirus sp.]
MGNSHSTATLESNTVVINQSDINVLNKTVNNITMNLMIDNAKSCGASILQSQDIGVGNLTVGRGTKVDIGQEQTAKMNFTCLQKDNVQVDIINKIADTLKQQLNNSANTDIINKLQANVQAKTQDQWASFPWANASANTDVKEKINTYVKNNTKVSLNNVIENATFATFKNTNVQDCLSKVIQSQKQTFGSITAEDGATLSLKQQQSTDLLAQCIQESNIAQSIMTDVIKFADLNLQIKKDTNVDNSMETVQEAEATKQGFFQGVSGFFTGIFGSYAGIASAICVILALCLCFLLIMLFFFGKSIKSLFSSDTKVAEVGVEGSTIETVPSTSTASLGMELSSPTVEAPSVTGPVVEPVTGPKTL